jgi:4-alpha-glucanotransferase
MYSRSSGILLHVTSLPGPYGTGDLGPEAYRFVDFLHRSHQTYWQVLPLVPVGYGDSPYASPSTFALNETLVSPEMLSRSGLLDDDGVAACCLPSSGQVPFSEVVRAKRMVISKSRARFVEHASSPELERFRVYCANNVSWLEDYALFAAIKAAHGDRSWIDWPAELRTREPGALLRAQEALRLPILDYKFGQYILSSQWRSLKSYCQEKNVQVVGDVPIYVAHDSADVWSHPHLFELESNGAPTSVAGVPPDYFSDDGQRWGNPLYRWDVMAQDGFAWWTQRMRAALAIHDVIRLDHFRGFEAFWSVPASESTARNGTWLPGPGTALFDALRGSLGDMSIIAEDLGLITDGVRSLKQRYQFPGMAILQFAFDGHADNAFLPHNYVRNLWAYTGTHDNETVQGWYNDPKSTQSAEVTDAARSYCLAYLDVDPTTTDELHWRFVRALYASVAAVVITPIQDLLGLGAEARMNVPGTVGGNWGWRLHDRSYTAVTERLRHLGRIYGRSPARATVRVPGEP